MNANQSKGTLGGLPAPPEATGRNAIGVVLWLINQLASSRAEHKTIRAAFHIPSVLILLSASGERNS
jgi:hypothetical protein